MEGDNYDIFYRIKTQYLDYMIEIIKEKIVTDR